MRIGNDRIRFDLDEASALDIGSMLVDGVEIAPGAAVPDDGDPRILRAVHGFLFTCGPDHIRHPEPIEGVENRRYPLHGSMSGHRAEVIEEVRTEAAHEVAAKIRIDMAQGGQADLYRRWRLDLATGAVEVEDRLVNIGKMPFPAMFMYHMNIGAHLFGEQTRLDGASFETGSIGWRFGEGEGHVFCVPAMSEDGIARVKLGPIAAIGDRSLEVWFGTATLPHLQMWRNEAGHCNVVGIEPVSHPWKTRAELAELGLMRMLTPGAIWTYRLGFAFR